MQCAQKKLLVFSSAPKNTELNNYYTLYNFQALAIKFPGNSQPYKHVNNNKNNNIHMCILGFTAFSLPGQFAPGSESANRTLANSLPGTFVPWPIRSLALSLVGLLASWNFAPQSEMARERNLRSLKLSHSGVFAPRNIRFLELSFPVSP